MSLQTDVIFVQALRSNTSLTRELAAQDVYNTTIALPDEDLDNAEVPYVIVAYDGMQNDTSTKDSYEGYTDTVSVSVTIAAKTRAKLSELAAMVRETVREYFEDATPSMEHYDLVPLDYQVSATRVSYDALKPCYWQALNYSCDTNID